MLPQAALGTPKLDGVGVALLPPPPPPPPPPSGVWLLLGLRPVGVIEGLDVGESVGVRVIVGVMDEVGLLAQAVAVFDRAVPVALRSGVRVGLG